MRPMETRMPTVQVLPRWLSGVVGGLPAGAFAACLIVISVIGGTPRIFGMTPRDNLLVIGLGAVLIGLVISLLIICVAQARALKALSRRG
jgi:hypothetical protein